MSEQIAEPTPYPFVNLVLNELLSRVQSILADHFFGMYLFGSLVTDDFDDASDIDVAVLTDTVISKEQFSQLKEMHAQFALMDSPWATQIEVAYLSLDLLRRYDPKNPLHPQLERGSGISLQMENHFRVVERAVLRERGIVVAGPLIQNLIDPISPNDLRQSMQEMFEEWIWPLLDEPNPFHSRGDQSYNVLSLCRVLYTIANGEIVSKLAAARWAEAMLGERWVGLIERALVGRHHSQEQPDARDVRETLALARLVYAKSQAYLV